MSSLVKEHPLIEALKVTGTGDYYLRPARDLALRNRNATDREVAQALIDAGPAFSITAEKALKICQGKTPKDLADSPPENLSEERAKHDRAELAKMFAEELGKKMGGALADPNVIKDAKSDLLQRNPGAGPKTTPASSK